MPFSDGYGKLTFSRKFIFINNRFSFFKHKTYQIIYHPIGTHPYPRTESIYEFILMLNSERCYQRSEFMMILVKIIMTNQTNTLIILFDSMHAIQMLISIMT